MREQLIFIPLMILFLTAIVSNADAFSGSTEFSIGGTTVGNDTLTALTQDINDLQDIYGIGGAHEGNTSMLRDDIDDLLDEYFPEMELYDRMGFYAGVRELIIENDTSYIISKEQISDILGQYATGDDLRGFSKFFNNVFGVSGLSFLGLFVTLMLIVSLVGVNFLSFGLSDTSIAIVTKLTAFYVLWGLLSSVSRSIIFDVPILSGTLWLGMTLIYTIGVFMYLGE